MTALYYAFAAGLAAGFVLTIGCVAVIAARKLGEDDFPETTARWWAQIAMGQPMAPIDTTKGLTTDRLRQLLSYDPDTGLFTRRITTWSRWKAGDSAGYISSVDGYVRALVDGNIYLGHRLAWLYVTGEWPIDQIDHINRKRSDNRFRNLREATNAENIQNCAVRANSTSGVTGVNWHSCRSKWQARINLNGRRKTLGYFDDFDAAVAARKAAEVKLYPFSPLAEAA